MIVGGYRSFYTEEELRADGFNDRMLTELLGAPGDELAKQPDMPPVEGHVWAALKVERAKERAIDAKMRSQSNADDSVDEWEPPEGFISIKQVRALGFSKTQVNKLLPEPAHVCLGGSERTIRVWRADDVEAAMRTNSFMKRQQKTFEKEREKAWRAVCADYGSDGDYE